MCLPIQASLTAKDGMDNESIISVANFISYTQNDRLSLSNGGARVNARAIASFRRNFVYTRQFSKVKLWIRSTADKKCGSSLSCSMLPDNVTDWHFGPYRSKPRRPHGYACVPINIRLND